MNETLITMTVSQAHDDSDTAKLHAYYWQATRHCLVRHR